MAARRKPTVQHWEPSVDVKCDRRLCGAVAHVAPAGDRRIIIECTKCQKFERSDTESDTLRKWRDREHV